jgi:hypothetical protein
VTPAARRFEGVSLVGQNQLVAFHAPQEAVPVLLIDQEPVVAASSDPIPADGFEGFGPLGVYLPPRYARREE